MPIPPPNTTSGSTIRARGAREETLLAHARAAAAGLLSSGVVHEFANLLTVVDGMRQMAALAPEAMPTLNLLDKPADRCGGVVEAFRHLFTDRGQHSTSSSARQDLECVRELLKAHVRGLPTRIEVSEAGGGLLVDGQSGVVLRAAFLCAVLGWIERSRTTGDRPAWIELSADGADERCHSFSADIVISGSGESGPRPDTDAFAELLLGLGRDLADASGGAFREQDRDAAAEGGVRLRIGLPG